MGNEEIVVRPFAGTESLQSLLSECHLFIGKQLAKPGSRTTIDIRDYGSTPISLNFASDSNGLKTFTDSLERGVAESELKLDEVALVVTISTPRLKTVDIVWEFELKQLGKLPRSVQLVTTSSKSESAQAPFGGCSIDAYILISRELEKQSLRPWRRGTWLGRARFEIDSNLTDVGFLPTPLRDEDRRRLGLNKSTVYYVSIENALEVGLNGNSLELFVDDGLLARLAKSPLTAASRLIQAQLFLDTMAALIYQASAEAQDAVISDIEGTLLDRLLERLSGSNRGSRQYLFEILKTRPALLVSHLQGLVTDLRSDIFDVLIEGTS